MNLRNPFAINPETGPEQYDQSEVVFSLFNRLNLAVWNVDAANLAKGIVVEKKVNAGEDIPVPEAKPEATPATPNREALGVVSLLSANNGEVVLPSHEELARQAVVEAHEHRLPG